MDSIIVEALLVQAPGERLRLLLGPWCLEFGLADVLDVEELGAPESLIEGSAIPARVTLRSGASVFRIAPSAPYRELLWKQRLPFALATRPSVIFDAQPGMRERERAFFAARGLTDKLP